MIKDKMLVIDGAYGEGGGQIIRTVLAMAAILSQPIRLENIRARRKNPGLAAQHLTAVRAAAMICDAELAGDELGSTDLMFTPRSGPIAGTYRFDVAEAREGGSAGAAALVLQTILLPLMTAQGTSEVSIRGGTHVSWSPSFDYIQNVYLPTLADLGLQATATLAAWGWYPIGEGEIEIIIPGRDKVPEKSELPISDQTWRDRGPLNQVTGVAVASSLPAHIAQRMRDRAVNLLDQANLPAQIEPRRVRSASPGAGIFLAAEYGDRPSRAGFSALGKKGKPSEKVAAEAVADFLAFHHSGAVVDLYLADQLIPVVAALGLPLVLSTEKLSSHTLTNIWVVEQFIGPVATIDYHHSTIHFIDRDKIF